MQRTQAFRILVPSFFSQCEQCNLLLPLLRNCSSLIDPFVFWRSTKFYLNQFSYFGNILINFKDVQSPEIILFETLNLFSHQLRLKKTAFVTTKIEINEPGLIRIYLHMVPNQEMQGRIQTSLVTEDMIINFSPVSKRLEADVNLGPGLLKNNILNCFQWPILYYRKNIQS